jgi:glycosyltransferase involved in cell wall biosynthesis
MLAPEALAFSPTKKRLYWRAVQRNVLQSASCIHATSDQEHDEIRQVGLKNPIAVIPNGIDLPHLPPRVQRPCTGRTALFLGRVHPKKGIERLIRAWALSGQKSDLWKLRIVGPDENGHTSELIRLANTLGLTNISFEGPLFGPDKWNVYRDADVFVLPTMNENFGLTVAESLACGTPVICTKGAPWSGLTTERCGWWTDASVEALASTLASSLSVPRDELHKMGTRGRFWMEREFSWTAVAIKTAAAYAWFITGGERPIFVRTISHHGP